MALSLTSIALDHGDAVLRSIRLGLTFNDESDGPRSTLST